MTREGAKFIEKVVLQSRLTRGGLRQSHVDLEREVRWRGHLSSADPRPISSIRVVQKPEEA